MKQKLLSFSIIFFAACMLSTNTFAQDTPGGEGTGSTGPIDPSGTGSTPQSTGVNFTRNNGDGTCGGMAQIRLYYTTAPTIAPRLTEIYYQGQPLYNGFTPVTANITDFASKGYASFCLTTSNIPPAIKLTLTYDASSSQNNISISGNN